MSLPTTKQISCPAGTDVNVDTNGSIVDVVAVTDFVNEAEKGNGYIIF